MEIEARHDSFQAMNDDPFWSESAYFPFLVPERNLSGWVYILHRRNMSNTVAGVAIWDPSGDASYDCLYYDWGDPLPLPAGADMFDFQLSNGLRVECVEPLHEFRLTYDNASVEVDLQWVAVAEPFVAEWGKSSRADDWATGHYEQRGRIVGRLVIAGESIDVDCWSNRDRSWGPRHYVNNPGGDFPWGIAEDGSGFHALSLDTRPRASQAVGDGAYDIVFGWYSRDGEVRNLVGGTRRTMARGTDGRPLRVRVEGLDADGRKITAEGRCVNWLKWHGYSTMFQWWCMTEWHFDGRVGWGEVMEFYPIEQGRRLLRTPEHHSAGQVSS